MKIDSIHLRFGSGGVVKTFRWAAPLERLPQCHFKNLKTQSPSYRQMNSRNSVSGFWILIPRSLTNASKPMHEMGD